MDIYVYLLAGVLVGSLFLVSYLIGRARGREHALDETHHGKITRKQKTKIMSLTMQLDEDYPDLEGTTRKQATILIDKMLDRLDEREK